MRRYRPLAGVRVIAFETAFALPAATRTLADLGAEVIRVPAPDAAEGERGVESFLNDQDVRINKMSLTLNLRHEQGLALAMELVKRADVVCSNLRPGAMERLGLGYRTLRALRSDVVVLQLSGYGSPGPWQSYPALGPATEAAGGLNFMIGDETYPPMRVGSDIYADQVAARFAVLALLAALERRRRTGEGQFIDLSMHASVVYLIGDLVISAARFGHPPRRYGNRHPTIAPQGIYPCAGKDEWVALSVVTDKQWLALRDLVQDPRLDVPSLSSAAERQRCHDMIDAAISAWTCRYEKEVAAELLQEHGIPAGPVRRPADYPTDPQLATRGFLQPMHHRMPVLGASSHRHPTLPWIWRGFERPRLKDPGREGGGNVRALKRWLAMSRREVTRLEAVGALWPARPLTLRSMWLEVGGPSNSQNR